MQLNKTSKLSIFSTGLILLLSTQSLLAAEQSKYSVDPFAVNNGNIPSKKEYDGNFFKFKYDYPTKLVEPAKKPWTEVLDGKPLTKEKAHEYIMALKSHIENPMRTFVTDQQKWNASSQNGWYSMLWAGENIEKAGWEGREAIYGTYTGQIQAASVYKDYGLKVNVRNHAAIYYDETAAYTLHKVWQDCNQTTGECPPSIEHGEAQFKEGSIVIKAAGGTATPEQWPVTKGAAKWKIFRKPFDLNGTIESAKPVVTDIRIAIFDIIVKDSIAAPETGWVFSTLVYDMNATGKDAWDKMVPLGAMWGNDPDVNSAKHPHQELNETYINPDAPDYAKVTLGYGGRLSGPFDIAVKYNVDVDGKTVKSLRSSSCLSCHGTSSFKPYKSDFQTFFYPVKTPITSPWKMYTPGSDKWNEWFQNRWGDVPQTKEKGAIALDYSTFIEGVLMNYAACIDEKPSKHKLSDEEFWKRWRTWQNERRH